MCVYVFTVLGILLLLTLFVVAEVHSAKTLHLITTQYLPLNFKAAIINIFYINSGSLFYLHMKKGTHSDELTENYHPTLLFPSAL